MNYDILPLLIKQLKQNFKLEVYDEPIQQGLSAPSFIVDCQMIKRERLANRNDKQIFLVEAQYFTNNTDTKREEFRQIEEIFMSDKFRYLGDRYHINNLEIERDDTLICSFTIERLIRWDYDGIKMGHMEGDVEFGEEESR